MSATASWARKHWLELAWLVFGVLNLAAIAAVPQFETVPFHFIWISLTLLYGYRVWPNAAMIATLAAVCVATGIALGWVVIGGPQGADELTEVPLMAAVFLAMVWHAQRRQVALGQVRRAAVRERAFLRDASHQLKTPIAVAKGYTDLVRSSTSSRQAREDLDTVVGELDRLGRLAEGLLLLATAEEERALLCESIDFEELIVGTAQRWRNAAPRHWRADVRAYGILLADSKRLDEALDVLIDNAIKATGPDDAIQLIGRAEGGAAVIEVADDGCGIVDEDLPRVFDRFWTRWPNGDAGRSTGLGLSIARAVAEAHHGRIDINSLHGLGTTVTLRLPQFTATEELPRRVPALDGSEAVY